jgi:hypothetical protein
MSSAGISGCVPTTVNISCFLFSCVNRATLEFSIFLLVEVLQEFSLAFSPLFFDMFYFLSIQEHHIQTNHGPVSVAVYGDHDKPALVTYPDIALNCKNYTCFKYTGSPFDFFQ